MKQGAYGPPIHTHHPWICIYAKVGMASLSMVYLLMGGLTARAAMGLGGESSDQKDVLSFLMGQPFGYGLIAAMVVGLGGYSLWRFIQAWVDPSEKGRGPKGLAIRAGYLISGSLYAGLAWYGLRLISRDASGREGEDAKVVAGTLLDQSQGQLLMALVAAGLLIAGLVQFYYVLSGTFRKRILNPETRRRHHLLIRWAGSIGFTARGVVLLIVAYLFWKSGRDANPQEAGGTDGAWGYLQAMPHGHLLLATVALGLAMYGVFAAMQAVSLQDDLAG